MDSFAYESPPIGPVECDGHAHVNRPDVIHQSASISDDSTPPVGHPRATGGSSSRNHQRPGDGW